MKSKILSLLIALLSFTALSSCSKDDAEKRIEFAKIVESRSSQDLLNDLYVGSDADVEAIARIMNVTPSSIERMRKGETEPTAQFEERIHEVAVFYMQNDQSFSKLQSVLDPEYGWYDAFLNAPSHHPWWFWGINIGLLVLSACAFFPPAAIVGGLGLLLELLFYCVVWISAWICSPDKIQDSYIETINPTIEQLK